MYADHAGIDTPPNPTKIWRYMDFPKFASMIDSSSLWFTRVGLFQDEYEGAVSVPSIRSFVTKQKFQSLAEANEFEQLFRGALNQISRRNYFANCWHMNDSESAAFWKIYGIDQLAVQSTVGRVKNALSLTGTPTVHIGQVEYMDDPEADTSERHTLDHIILKKRNVYSYERELRLFFNDMPPSSGELTEESFNRTMEAVPTEPIPPGYPVPVDLNVLIERVYVASNQPSWFEGLLRSLLSRYGYGGMVVQRSRLYARPKHWRDPVAMRDGFREQVMSYQQPSVGPPPKG